MRQLAIEGIDGSGKTTVCTALEKQLTTEGLKVARFEPYRIANEVLGKDIYDLWFSYSGCAKAIGILADVIDDCEFRAEKEQADVCIFDRHWMTAWIMFEGRERMEEIWYNYGPSFVPTALLRVPIETALERRGDEEQEAWMDAGTMGEDAVRYACLARGFGEHILGIYRSDDDVSPEAIARNIVWDMNIRR